MKTLLQITTSIFGDAGQSTGLVKRYVAAWHETNPDAIVLVRDLANDPVPHIDAARFGALLSNPDERTLDQQAVVDYSDALIDELRRADVVVLGLPMYNFAIPSTLKAYFDHIARVGITFQYTDKGPVGLLKGKEVVVFAARGGVHVGTPVDTQTAYVAGFLAFLGMDTIEFVYAEGLAMGEASKQNALAEAHAAIERLVQPERVAA